MRGSGGDPIQFVITLLVYVFLIVLLVGGIQWAWNWAAAQ